MKTLLLTFVALVVSAQTVDRYYSPDLPSAVFTNSKLNGVWWQHATREERWIYLQAVSDTLGRHVWLTEESYKTRETSVPMIDAIRTENPEPEK